MYTELYMHAKPRPQRIHMAIYQDNLYVLYNGCMTGLTAAQLTNMTSCIGDDVTYICNVDSLTHIWNFGELTGNVSLGDPLYTPHSFHVFTLERVFGNSSSSIVSTLSVTAFAGLNGTQISCRDGNVTEDEAERQMTIVMLFGKTYNYVHAHINTSVRMTLIVTKLHR